MSGHIPKPEFTTIHHIECSETTTLQHKFSILGSISNYHWWNYICCSGQVSASSSHVNLHSADVTDDSKNLKILKSYNPEEVLQSRGSLTIQEGIAYYFTEHGGQIRNQPSYNIKSTRKNYDDNPIADDICHKIFPSVSYGGYSYMFLWFCPMHGHSYGFHIISGSEGRKDAYSSLYKYKPHAPSDIFYDFACQLCEYCLNRAPDYFKSTRFWHDLFHGICHKCGKPFKSTRITGMTGVNSEICEQFNSYLQCIKYTATHLSQKHFMFFTQFFMYLWNREKTEIFNNIIDIAIAGIE